VVDGVACVSLALVLWLTKNYVPIRVVPFLRWIPWLSIAAILSWIVVRNWIIILNAIHVTRAAPPLREIFGLEFLIALAAALICGYVRSSRNAWAPSLVSATLVVLSIYFAPAALKQSRTIAAADAAEFMDWAAAIPPASTILIVPPRDVGTFVWFTLQRPNYLAVDQSAGVVFSRATALEVQRRSQVLLPLMDPNWKILTRLRTGAADKRKGDAATRPLTALTLRQICTDSQLGFVISTSDVGFDHVSHEEPGPWLGWNLYDCRKVRPRV
jgi:hypothetical protein